MQLPSDECARWLGKGAGTRRTAISRPAVAVDTKTGKTLCSFNTGGSVGGEVITCEVRGKQNGAALSGVVSGFFGGSSPAAVLIFALP